MYRETENYGFIRQLLRKGLGKTKLNQLCFFTAPLLDDKELYYTVLPYDVSGDDREGYGTAGRITGCLLCWPI